MLGAAKVLLFFVVKTSPVLRINAFVCMWVFTNIHTNERNEHKGTLDYVSIETCHVRRM